MNARLTMDYGPQQNSLVFKLTCAKAVVGRRPVEVSHLPEVVAKIERREAFSVELEDTLFVGIPWELGLSRNHFAISMSAESGQTTYWIEDLGSRCGFHVNGEGRFYGQKERRLNSGDKIHCGFEFEFHVD